MTSSSLTATLANYESTTAAATLESAAALTTTLANYVTSTALSAFGYVTGTSLTSTLSGYVTGSSLTSTLSGYVTSTSLAAAGYITSSSLTSTLSGYVTSSALTTALASYETSAAAAAFETSAALTTTLAGYATTTALSAETTRATGVEGTLSSLTTSTKTNLVSAINEVITDIGNCVTSSSLTTTLASYETTAALATTLSGYVTTSALTNGNYITQSSLSTTLQGYVTNASLTGTLANYESTANAANLESIANLNSTLANYVTSASLTNTLNSYVTTSTLASYSTTASMNSTLSGYVTNTSLGTTLQGYVTNSSLSGTLGNYALTSALSNYVTSSSLASTLSTYVTSSALSNYETTTALATTLADYVTASQCQQNAPTVPTGTGGTADALTATYSPVITTLTNGMTLLVRASAANATQAPTFTPNSGTVATHPIVKGAGVVLAQGDIAGAGHWLELQYDTTLSAWALQNPANGVVGRIRLQANLTLYVSTSGSDTANGLTSAAPFATLTHAWNVVQNSYDLNGYAVTVQLAAGTYTVGGVFSGVLVGATGPSSFTVLGSTSTPASYIISVPASSTCIGAMYGANITLSGIQLQSSSTASFGIFACYTSLVLFNNVVFGAFSSGYQIASGDHSEVTANGPYKIAGAALCHIYGFKFGIANTTGQTITITGTPAFTQFVLLQDMAHYYAASTTFSGTATGKRYTLTTLSLVDTNGGGTSYLPGGTAGTTATSAVYN